jgi:hypothetical protein
MAFLEMGKIKTEGKGEVQEFVDIVELFNYNVLHRNIYSILLSAASSVTMPLVFPE